MLSAEQLRRIDDLAKRNAELFSPRPTHQPVPTGIIGAIVCVAAAWVFELIAGLDIEAFQNATIGTGAVGFIVPFVYLKSQISKYQRAYAAEFSKLEAEAEKLAAPF
jgi:hypothetical protein